MIAAAVVSLFIGHEDSNAPIVAVRQQKVFEKKIRELSGHSFSSGSSSRSTETEIKKHRNTRCPVQPTTAVAEAWHFKIQRYGCRTRMRGNELGWVMLLLCDCFQATATVVPQQMYSNKNI